MLNDGSLTHLDSPGNLTAGPVAAFVDGSNLEDGNDHVVDIVWDPSGPEMRVSMNCEERLIASIDLIHDIFDGHPIVQWGFTAEADGALNSERDSLTINGLEVATDELASPDQTTIALFVYDSDADGETSAEAVSIFSNFPFLAGVDAHFGGGAGSTIDIVLNGRSIKTPAWPAGTSGVTIAVFD